MLANKHTRNSRSLSDPSDHAARGVPAQDTLARTPLWLTMIKVLPSGNGPQDPKQANRNDYGQLALSPQALICPPPLLGHHPMVTSLLDQRKVIIQLKKDGNGERTFELGPIITMSCHPWDPNSKNKTHQIPPEKTHLFNVCLARKPRGKRLLAQVALDGWRTYSVNPPNTMNHLFLARVHPPNHLRTFQLLVPLLPAQSSSSTIHPSDPPSHFSFPDSATLHSCSPPDLPPIAAKNPTYSSLPVPSSSHSYDDTCQQFTNLRPTLMIPPAINQILLGHHCLLHMIPFVDATHQNEMHWEFQEELNSLLGQALEGYPKEDITGIVSKYLEK
ncbi:hypothetical protein O181_035542 [Austropuccinia psidii MF-1]|uniref:Uncharacterized protein n=1 Tax=Austropuccinia psidii MF-1 TaxID=1389203 RepID=A0A9Q3D8U6_9BASI|nr:hypothetical protein [Austropuccinia psidii MF-1]